MAGIAGIFASNQQGKVEQMLDLIKHRGPAGRKVIELPGATLGVVYNRVQVGAQEILEKETRAVDWRGPDQFASATLKNGAPSLERDFLGVAPLYYAYDAQGNLCFASEFKALYRLSNEVKELPYGSCLEKGEIRKYFELEKRPFFKAEVEEISRKLRALLEDSITKRIGGMKEAGSWLSGGLDSSTIATLLRDRVDKLYTFAAGFSGAEDLEYARVVADYIGSQHQEVIINLEDAIRLLPEVIYHLESFDALLVRSSITNYAVSKVAAEYVPVVFSGEGGDELFAGYDYLKSFPEEKLTAELIDILGRLHNTALQRVDRSSAAHGLLVHVPFVDREIVSFALSIPPEYKIKEGIEKWILRKAVEDKLPDRVLWRRKAKFWQGAGVEELVADYAEKRISDSDFARERNLPNGWLLHSKEELLYYRIFKEHFGERLDLNWMGRSKLT
ncbi:MAG: asparagine synthase [Candidatus Atribacteria bacterium]|nr:asparagine synthase [Candidatus Atribacteria bacterium]MCD6349886.1 asparagine synthase [Candidatus Atribacteria bacterium]